MPLIPINAATGQKLPRAEWSEGDRAAWIDAVLQEQRLNHDVGVPVDTAAIDDAEKLAGDDPSAHERIRDLRHMIAEAKPRAPAARAGR